MFSMKSAKRSVAILIFMILVTPARWLIHAQTGITYGAIRGVVSDSTEAAIQGAKVTLVSLVTAQKLTHVTNADGVFVFPSEPAGRYIIEVAATGFRNEIVNGIEVQIGQTTTVKPRLQPGAGRESITVSGESPLLQTEDANQSTIVGRELLDDLPLNGRRFLDFALLVPNANPDGQNGLVSFAGEEGGQDTAYANANGANSFTVDGASATSNYFGNARGGEKVPYIFGENAIEQFQVAVSPYRADYGGAATGFVNAVTRSGTDEIQGNAFYYNRNSGTGANDAIDKAAGFARPVDILQQFGGSVGGPLVKHRLWYFADYEQQIQKDPITAINSGFTDIDVADAFGLPDGTVLPPPNAPLPVPSSLNYVPSAGDPNYQTYLQDASNALNGIQTNLGIQSRYGRDWSLFSKIDYRDSKDDRFYLSLNWNRFDSPNGFILGTQTALFGRSTLASAFVRDYHASAGWSHAYGSNLLNEVHGSFSRDDQYSTPTGVMNPVLPTVLLTPGSGEGDNGGSNFQIGNAGFAGGRTNEATLQFSDHVSYLHGKDTFKFGVEFTRTHLTDLAFGGFDPDAQAQNGTFRGTYTFASDPTVTANCPGGGSCWLAPFALGVYNNFFQSTGQPTFSFNVPYFGFYFHDTYQIRQRLTLELGIREDFQVYPQPKENAAFPLTGQFPNQYQRVAPRFGFAWQALDKTVVRGGFGMFYENLNGLNYRNAVVSNGLLSQQASVSLNYDNTVAPNRQLALFPNQVSNPSLFQAGDISLVDPSFKFPYILQSNLQIEREILRDTVLTVGTSWSHGVHLISSSAYDLNLIPPTGTTTYTICPAVAQQYTDCTGSSVALPNLDSGLLQEGRINPNLGQINALITAGINNYNSFFVQGQRRFRHGLRFQTAYTFAKNMMSHGVDFNNQFDFSNTHAPYLIDQRHRLSIGGAYQPALGSHLPLGALRSVLSDWTISTVMQFASGRPYAALLDTSSLANSVNNSAALQATANSALGINGSAPSPFAGLDSIYGPWTQQIDLSLSRRFKLTERHSLSLLAQVFNIANHANYYVQNGTGVSANQYAAAPFGNNPDGSTNCGDGATLNQNCYLVPATGFGTLQIINYQNPPRIMQFALKWTF
jgi:Carboxypeptidase regulatory-like domain